MGCTHQFQMKKNKDHILAVVISRHPYCFTISTLYPLYIAVNPCYNPSISPLYPQISRKYPHILPIRTYPVKYGSFPPSPRNAQNAQSFAPPKQLLWQPRRQVHSRLGRKSWISLGYKGDNMRTSWRHTM